MRARHTDPSTSHEAAAKATASSRETYDAILQILSRMGEVGQTTHEMEVNTGIQLVSISPCMKPMEKLQLVTRTVRRRKWKSSCIVWVSRQFATDEERAAADASHGLLA